MLSEIEDTRKSGKDGAVDGAVPTGYYVFQDGGWRLMAKGEVIEERECCIYINGKELISLAATPIQLEELALGFLVNEGLLKNFEEVKEISIQGNGSCVDIWLDRKIKFPERKVITSGCTGGVTFNELAARLNPLSVITPLTVNEIQQASRVLYEHAQLYRITRGVHTSILWKNGKLLAAAEDVGRHNTLDKLRGFCLKNNLDPQGSLLVSTGRISSEMLVKAARMQCPVVVSRTSATSLSVQLAQEWKITLIGYFRAGFAGVNGRVVKVYSHPENLVLEAQ